MTKLRNLFFNTKMSWRNVIVLSLITGVVIGLVMIPDCLDDTSFQNPGATTEFWFLWALFIILNCEKPFEAGLKTFVAFLISQPVIYLVQVPFTWMGWEIFGYYKLWFVITLMTFPGGMIAWYVKKGNALSVAILSVANLSLCLMLTDFAARCIASFPHHLLTVLFIIAEIVFFILIFFDDKKMKKAAFIVAAVLLIISTIVTINNANQPVSSLVEAEGPAPYELVFQVEASPLDVSFSGSFVRIEYRNRDIKDLGGEETIIYKDADGAEHEIHLEYRDGSLYHDEE